VYFLARWATAVRCRGVAHAVRIAESRPRAINVIGLKLAVMWADRVPQGGGDRDRADRRRNWFASGPGRFE
jgi:hypothetical protein